MSFVQFGLSWQRSEFLSINDKPTALTLTLAKTKCECPDLMNLVIGLFNTDNV